MNRGFLAALVVSIAIHLRADRTLPYEKVLAALIAIQQTGVAQVHLAYEEAERGR